MTSKDLSENKKQLIVNSKGPVVLIDGSYFIFHRFFATLKWYKFRNPDIDEATCMDNAEFREAIMKHTMDTMTKIKKKWAGIATEKKRLTKNDIESVPVWFALDSHRGDIWRNSITEGYKGTRDGARPAFDPSCFVLLINAIATQLPMLQGRGLEADDVIAVIHKQLRTQGYDGLIVCITNDNDYLQLLDTNTRLFNLMDKDIAERSCGCPHKDLLFKILLGDKSDNIPPISTKIKEKHLKEMLGLSVEEIVQTLGLTEEEKQRMEHNRKIIDFSYIPEELVNECLAGYTIMVNKN